MLEPESITHIYGGSFLSNEPDLNIHAVGLLTCELSFKVYTDAPSWLCDFSLVFQSEKVNLIGSKPTSNQIRHLATQTRAIAGVFQGYHTVFKAPLVLDGLLWTQRSGELNFSDQKLSLQLVATVPAEFTFSGNRYGISLQRIGQ